MLPLPHQVARQGWLWSTESLDQHSHQVVTQIFHPTPSAALGVGWIYVWPSDVSFGWWFLLIDPPTARVSCWCSAHGSIRCIQCWKAQIRFLVRMQFSGVLSSIFHRLNAIQFSFFLSVRQTDKQLELTLQYYCYVTVIRYNFCFRLQLYYLLCWQNDVLTERQTDMDRQAQADRGGWMDGQSRQIQWQTSTHGHTNITQPFATILEIIAPVWHNIISKVAERAVHVHSPYSG